MSSKSIISWSLQLQLWIPSDCQPCPFPSHWKSYRYQEWNFGLPLLVQKFWNQELNFALLLRLMSSPIWHPGSLHRRHPGNSGTVAGCWSFQWRTRKTSPGEEDILALYSHHNNRHLRSSPGRWDKPPRRQDTATRRRDHSSGTRHSLRWQGCYWRQNG